MRRTVLALILTVATLPGLVQTRIAAQAPSRPSFELTVDNLMRGAGLIGYEPRALRWSGDGQRLYFQWKQFSDPREKEYDTYEVHRNGSGLRKLSEEEARVAPPATATRSGDRTLGVYAQDGDVWLYNYTTDKARRLTRTGDAETNPQLTPDGARAIFTRAGNLFALSLADGAIEQLTDIRAPGAAPATAPPSGRGGGAAAQQARPPVREDERRGTDSQEFLKTEEKDLLDVVQRRAAQRAEEEARRKRENPRKPLTLTGRQSASQLQLSPDGQWAIARIVEPGQDAKNTIVPNYVTESAYTEDLGSRTKVGDNQERARLALIAVETGEVTWVDHGLRRPPASGTDKSEKEDQERQVALSMPVWSEDGARVVLLGRASDNKDRWIFALDPATGKTRVLVAEHDAAWVGGPGANTLGWMKDDRRVFFQSERTGYSHLYVVDFDDGEPRALTSGEWEVTALQLSDDRTRFFLTTSESSPFERHVYVMPADGGNRVKLTGEPGFHQAVPAPDEKTLGLLSSFTTRPPEVYVQASRPGALPSRITSSPAPDFSNYKWLDAPIVHFTARDGVSVPARLFRPAGWKRGGPGVIFVHGAGYAQNVHRGWSSNSGPYLFHHLLVARGYLVLDVDYRASSGYGRDWRTAIYRHMGGKDLDDEVDAARWMAREHDVDARRIGIYGGSYGGFMTLMAMFTAPDVFAAGAAMRPVTDWAHYNHGYTSNILNLPQADAEAYRRSSPIYHAEGLKGALLICHGVVDTNVHFQDTVRLVQRLIELRKENWELAIYPVEDHGFVEPTSWADEYKRLLKLFDRHLMAAKP